MLNLLCAYRGQIRGVVAAEQRAVFITEHPEQQATAVYSLDTSKEDPDFYLLDLPCSATAIIGNAQLVVIAGSNGQLYAYQIATGQLAVFSGIDLGKERTLALAFLANHRLAVLQKKTVVIVDVVSKKITQHLPLTETATALSANPEGTWFAVGQTKGLVQVFHNETDNEDFVLSNDGRIHQGDVTALTFTADLQFYSAGKDKKLFLTHARGTLQPLDKGKGSNHEADITAIVLGKTRFFTVADDKTLKAWAYTGGQPSNLRQGLAKAEALALISYQNEPALLLAGADNTLRLIGLDTEEKPTEVKVKIDDAYAYAKDQFTKDDSKIRQKTIELLAAYDDHQGFNLLHNQLKVEAHLQLRELIVDLAGQAQHQRAITLLNAAIKDNRHESVRQKAFAALCTKNFPDALYPYELALTSGYEDVGAAALNKLGELYAAHPRTEFLIQQALVHRQTNLRLLALSVLEKIYPDSAQASLQALNITQTDVQRAALIRLYQRKLLSDFAVKRALLVAQNANEAEVRQTAFFVTLLGQEKLAQAIKSIDAEAFPELQKITDFSLLGEETEKPKEKTKKSNNKANTATTKANKKLVQELGNEDYGVLLQGLSNPHADIRLLAALILARLEDQRAFGMLSILSRGTDSAIRQTVATAFAYLGDKSAIPTLALLLNDQESSVAEAAFTTLLKLDTNKLANVQRGINSKHEEIHARSLKTLLEEFTASTSQTQQGEALRLLQVLLNDRFEKIRQETFKICLNRQLGGDLPSTLKLLLQTQYENLHQEVLNEVMAASATLPILDWVEPVLLELFNNPFLAIRHQAFTFALDKKKRFNLQQVLATAVKSRFLDLRERIINDYLPENPSLENQVHLQILLSDPEETIRAAAVRRLTLQADMSVQTETLRQALDTPYPDVQAEIAHALARLGEQEVAFPVLLELASRPEPHDKQEWAKWQIVCREALEGLAWCANPQAFALVSHVLAHKDKELNQSAAWVLPWVVNSTHIPQLQKWQTDERPYVRAYATLALALLGDASAEVGLADSKVINAELHQRARLAAILNLAPPTPVRLQALLEDSVASLSSILVLMSEELIQHTTEPYLSVWSLGINEPNLQLLCAQLLVSYHDPAARWQVLLDWLLAQQAPDGQKKEELRWRFDLPTLQTLAAILVYGSGQLRARCLAVLIRLNHRHRIDWPAWEVHYTAFTHRFAAEIAEVKQRYQQNLPSTKVIPTETRLTWQQHAFGAYLGVLRQENSRLSYRLQALRGLLTLAHQELSLRNGIEYSVLALLNHEQAAVHELAFTGLQELGMDLAMLGQAATASSASDIAERGLELLVTHYPLQDSYALLRSLIQSNHETLAPKAWDLYRKDIDCSEAAPLALQSAFTPLRHQVVAELANLYKEPAAQHTLLLAAQNDVFSVAQAAIQVLVQQQHPQTLSVLSTLFAQRPSDQDKLELLPLFQQMANSEAATYLFTYLEQHSLSRDVKIAIYQRIAVLRPIALFAPMLTRLEQHAAEAKSLIPALLAITGYDQEIVDFAEESDDKTWLKRQHPRQDALLIQLFTQLIRLNYVQEACAMVRGLAWMQDKAADQALREVIPALAVTELKTVVAAIAHRAEKRQGSTAALLQVLSHTDAEVQFLAAEGLAKVGQQQGVGILLAAMDYQSDDEYRCRAVLALGRSGDERALDKLLKLANDDEHLLYEPAIEALGHLGQGEAGERIFKQIKSALHNASYWSDLIPAALNGLRWLNTQAAWQLIQNFTLESGHYYSARIHAVNLLQHRDSEGNRQVLLRLLREDHASYVVEAAYNTARRLWQATAGVASEPDYALLQGNFPQHNPRLLDMVLSSSTTPQLLNLLNYAYPENTGRAEEIRNSLGQGLLRREDISVADLLPLLSTKNPEVMIWASRLSARFATRQLAANLPEELLSAVQFAASTYYQRWQAELASSAYKTGDANSQQTATAHHQALQEILVVLVQLNAFSPLLLQLLQTTVLDERELQLTLLQACLAQASNAAPEVLAAMTALHTSDVLQVSTLASEWLAQQGKVQGLNWQRLTSQPETLRQAEFTSSIQAAAAMAQQQALALPILIAKQDVVTLLAVANNTDLAENIRLGAIEGLARIPAPTAEQALQQLKTTLEAANDEDLAKAIYRALRRWQRAQTKLSTANTASTVTGVAA